MAYTIYNAGGTPMSVPDNAADTTYYTGVAYGPGQGIYLVGRNTINYGAPIAQNFLQLTENFASSVRPADARSLVGQLWFDKTALTLNVKVKTAESNNADNWRKVIVTNPVTPGDGDIRVVGSVISIYAGGAWRQVFPAVYS